MTARLTNLVHRCSQQQLTLLVVCMVLFFNVLNGTMVNIALPAIGRDFGIEPARLGWIATGYLLVFGVAVPWPVCGSLRRSQALRDRAFYLFL